MINRISGSKLHREMCVCQWRKVWSEEWRMQVSRWIQWTVLSREVQRGTVDYYDQWLQYLNVKGSFGADCSFECSCENGATCDAANGKCICAPGFTVGYLLMDTVMHLSIKGPQCEESCGKGTWGKNCESKCECLNQVRRKMKKGEKGRFICRLIVIVWRVNVYVSDGWEASVKCHVVEECMENRWEDQERREREGRGRDWWEWFQCANRCTLCQGIEWAKVRLMMKGIV